MSKEPARAGRNRNGLGGQPRASARAARAVLLAAAVIVAACESAPKSPPPSPAPAAVSLQDYMQQASQASNDGSREKARDAYRMAARAYPASKQPWSKLAEEYFAAGDYGNAILAAQEVLLRDANDTVATSVLAVSGLRVSASSLQKLKAQNRISGDARSEAETMTQTLREVLGEDVLVPRAGAAPAKSRPASRSVAALRPARAAASGAASAAASANPFDKLK